MRVTSTGNVGILNTSPSSKVHIGSNSTSGALGIGLQNDQRFYTINTDGGSLTFKDESAAAERMRITSAGMKESHPHDVYITREAPNYSHL